MGKIVGTNDFFSEIQADLIDMIVHGSKSSHINCEIFSHLDPDIHMLIELDDTISSHDLSINRCLLANVFEKFSFEDFQLSYPTPGEINFCTKQNEYDEALHSIQY